jgi:hypothetical protein
MLAVILIVVGLILAIAAPALASPDAGLFAPPDPESANFFGDVYHAVANHNWRYVAAAGIIGVVFLARRYFKTKLTKGKWAWLTTIVVGCLGALVTYLLSNTPVSASGVFGAVLNGAFLGSGAAGLYKGFSEWTRDR